MAKIKIDSNLYARVQKASEAAGYSSVQEFIAHVIETEVAKHEAEEPDEDTMNRLRGLGYID